MLIIAAQVHAYERNHPGRLWVGVLPGPDAVTGEAMVAAMEAVGVAGAVLVSPFALYGDDASYALEVSRQHPGRFGLVKPVNPTDPAVAEPIADWAATPGTIGIRLLLQRDAATDPAAPGLHRVLAAAAQHALPVNVMGPGRLEQVAHLVARHPQTQVVLDHLGLPQPFAPPAPAEPFADRPKLLALAAYPNVAVNISGACTLSRAPCPFPTCGIRWRISSTPSACGAVCGVPTGPAPSTWCRIGTASRPFGSRIVSPTVTRPSSWVRH